MGREKADSEMQQDMVGRGGMWRDMPGYGGMDATFIGKSSPEVEVCRHTPKSAVPSKRG